MKSIFQWNDIRHRSNRCQVSPVAQQEVDMPAANDSTFGCANSSVKNRLKSVFTGTRNVSENADSTCKPDVTLSRSGIVLLNAYVADNWLARLRGLFALNRLETSEALLISPCSAVHSIGLDDSIDIVFIDKAGTVLKCLELKPFSMAACLKAHSVIEMTSGTMQRLNLMEKQTLTVETLVQRGKRLPYDLERGRSTA